MSNIQAAGGLKAAPLQTSGKQDGQGNGSGGMYFGGGYQEEQNDQFYSSYSHYGDADMKDVPFFVPIFGFVSETLNTWKTAVAKIFYKDQANHQ